MSRLIADLRYAARTLASRPGFAAATIAVLTLGLALQAAVFGMLQSVLWRPLPFAAPDQLVLVWESLPDRGVHEVEVAPANFLDYRRQNDVFTDMALTLDERYAVTALRLSASLAVTAALKGCATSVRCARSHLLS